MSCTFVMHRSLRLTIAEPWQGTPVCPGSSQPCISCKSCVVHESNMSGMMTMFYHFFVLFHLACRVNWTIPCHFLNSSIHIAQTLCCATFCACHHALAGHSAHLQLMVTACLVAGWNNKRPSGRPDLQWPLQGSIAIFLLVPKKLKKYESPFWQFSFIEPFCGNPKPTGKLLGEYASGA